MSDRIEFEHEGVWFAVVLPTEAHLIESNKVKNTTFADALANKAMLRAKMDTFLREQNLWDDTKQAQLNTIDHEIVEAEKALLSGNMKLSAAKELALKLKKLRADRVDMLFVRRELDNKTAEGQADNVSFNYLVSACLVYKETELPYYKSLTDYMLRSSETLGYLAASHLASLLHGYDNDFEQKLPENQFLHKYHFTDKKFRLINKDGKLIDEKGRLINEDGELVDEAGHLVDIYGNRRKKDGSYDVEFKPFLDDDGNVITVASEEEPAVELPVSVSEPEPEPVNVSPA